MAEFLEVPFQDVVLAALIPAILYYIALFIQADLYAAKENITITTKNQYKIYDVLKNGWLYIFPFVIIIVSLFHFNLRPQTSAINAVLCDYSYCNFFWLSRCKNALEKNFYSYE